MSNKNQIESLGQEQAYEEVEKLENGDRYSADGAEVYRGMHPEWGPTIIIFPAFGKAIHIPMMMPVQAAIQPEVTIIKNADF